MKYLQKKLFSFAFILCLVAPVPALAASGTYTSTYDFTGGLYSVYLNMNGNTNVTVSTTPNLKLTDSRATKIGIQLMKKGFFGDSLEDSSWNWALQNDSCTVTTGSAGDYRIYYYAYTSGWDHVGDTTISY